MQSAKRTQRNLSPHPALKRWAIFFQSASGTGFFQSASRTGNNTFEVKPQLGSTARYRRRY